MVFDSPLQKGWKVTYHNTNTHIDNIIISKSFIFEKNRYRIFCIFLETKCCTYKEPHESKYDDERDDEDEKDHEVAEGSVSLKKCEMLNEAESS